jgi:type IV pilus assembly protein PilY1
VRQTVVTTGANGEAVSEEVKGTLRTISAATPVDWSVKNGWYVDLETAGERINVDMQLAFNTLTAAGNVPGATATDCTDAGSGTSWLYQLNVVTGNGSADLIDSMVAGLSTVQLGKGTGVTIVTKTDVSQPLSKTIDPSTASSGTPRRSSWRELVD